MLYLNDRDLYIADYWKQIMLLLLNNRLEDVTYIERMRGSDGGYKYLTSMGFTYGYCC